jgi:adhesin HecA-like repeat protein
MNKNPAASGNPVMKLRFAAALLSGFAAMAAYAAPTVTVQASPAPAVAGSTVGLDVSINDISDLFVFQFTLSFDPSVLQATSVSEGAFLSTGGTTFFIEGTIDNTAGTISFTADSLIGAIPGVSGSGLLTHFNFNAVQAGSSALTFSDVLFLNSASNDIAVLTPAGSLNVVSAVPEPASVMLALAGLPLLALAARRRRGVGA